MVPRSQGGGGGEGRNVITGKVDEVAGTVIFLDLGTGYKCVWFLKLHHAVSL